MANLIDLFDDFDRFYPSVFRREAAPPMRRLADPFPRAEIRELDHGYQITLEVPGCSPADVDVNVNDDVLSVKGNSAGKGDEGVVLRTERTMGEFSRDFRLPKNCQPGDVAAKVENGLLTITIPKAEQVKSTRIEVR